MLYKPKWSKAKKTLQSFTCEPLRSRIDFHIINYRKAHDQLGRAVITVDKMEQISMCTYTAESELYYKEWEIREHRNDINVDEIEHNCAIQYEAYELMNQEAIYGQYDFFSAIEKLFNAPIEELLTSKDPIMRILCLIDRRVGKRTLRKMRESIDEEHSLVQYFYQLRCEAEDIWIG